MLATRRSFLGGVLIAGCAGAPRGAARAEAEEEVTPSEDLMREHGVLRRVMFIYDEAAMRLEATREVPLDALASAAMMIRRVIEDYHEKLEEDFLFPRFEKAGNLADLTAVLRRQHQVGRGLTEQILVLAKAPPTENGRENLVAALRGFNHMYRPHAAREDTVLFPELRGLVGAKAYKELGEQFEEKEKQMLGEHGFEHAVGEVATIEHAFGVDDLAKLTA